MGAGLPEAHTQPELGAKWFAGRIHRPRHALCGNSPKGVCACVHTRRQKEGGQAKNKTGLNCLCSTQSPTTRSHLSEDDSVLRMRSSNSNMTVCGSKPQSAKSCVTTRGFADRETGGQSLQKTENCIRLTSLCIAETMRGGNAFGKMDGGWCHRKARLTLMTLDFWRSSSAILSETGLEAHRGTRT